MAGFLIKTQTNQIIRFSLYADDAPHTVAAFLSMLPFARTLFHARLSGQEIWADNAHELDIIQENASVFTNPGEIVLGPLKPSRTKTCGCIGIYYGEGRGLDCCNIFGKVMADDMAILRSLGESVWKNGEQLLKFERL